MAEKFLLVEKQPERKVAYLTFNRPEKLNAWLLKDEDEITQTLFELNEDDDVKVIVFRGAGRCFGTGHDVAEIGVMHDQPTGLPGDTTRRPPQRKRLGIDRGHIWGRTGWIQGTLFHQKATIAQVHGYCYGGHFELMNCCDICVASEDASFIHPGYRYIGPLGEIPVLILTMGLKRVKEMMLTGTPLTAQQALAYGLINRVVTREKLEEETENVVEAVCRMPFDGIVMGKANFEATLDAMGVTASLTTSAIIHAMQTAIRFEPGEFNLLKARRDGGVRGAIQGRLEHYNESTSK